MKRFSLWVMRLLLGGVFVFAGAIKIMNPQQFATEIDQYQLVPHALIHLAAITLPWVELVSGLALVSGVWVRPAALVVTGLSSVFLVAIVSVMVRGLKIKCGCFGTVGDSFVGWPNLALDLVLLLLAVWLVWKRRD